MKRLEILGIKFLIVHSPSIAELNNEKLIKENFVLNKLKEQFPNEYINLDIELKLHFANNDIEFYKDNIHYGKKGHKIVGNFLNPKIIELTNIKTE